MSHRAGIGQRIKKLRNEKNFSQTHVASILFISQAAYSLIENSQNGIVVDHIIKLSELYDISTDFILKGENNYIKVGRKNGFVPLIRAQHHSEFINNPSDDFFADIDDWYRVPGFEPIDSHRLFEVNSNDMTPTILSGDILICQNHKKFDEILDGTAVILVTGDQIFLKRFKKPSEDGYFIIENDGDYPSENNSRIKKTDVKEIMIVKGKISSGLVSFHDVSGKGKINALEKDLELLKNELSNMNEKLTILSSKKDS